MVACHVDTLRCADMTATVYLSLCTGEASGLGEESPRTGATCRPCTQLLPPGTRCFRPVLAHVQMLWELMLLGEPLLVLAPSPDISSELVLALTRWVPRLGQLGPRVCSGHSCSPSASGSLSCLQPLRFCCDFRPYFTVHDSEFKEFSTRTQAP